MLKNKSPFDSFQSRFVTYLLNFPRVCVYIYIYIYIYIYVYIKHISQGWAEI